MTPTLVPFQKTFTRFYRNNHSQMTMRTYILEHSFAFSMSAIYKILWGLFWILSVLSVWAVRSDPDLDRRTIVYGLGLIILYYLFGHVPMLTENRFLLPGFFPLIMLSGERISKMKAFHV